MKVILITTTTPAVENIRGTSALPYHLIVRRDEKIDVEIYSFNTNGLSEKQIRKVEDELKVKIHLLNKPRWMKWASKPYLLFFRILMRYPFLSYLTLDEKVINTIKSEHPDGIWIYGEEISKLMTVFPEYKRAHIGPDSEALYYYRMMGRLFVANNRKMLLRQMIMYPKYLRLEREYSTDSNATYYLVGEADAAFVKRMNPDCHAVFLRHPHYKVDSSHGKVKFHDPIRLLIAGQNNYYMREDANELIDSLSTCKDDALKASFELTFLGKGWEDHVKRLKGQGWNVKQIVFAPDYIEEVKTHDIQITPISIGTGTKGKVLDALSNGLLVIGTPYAMENIAVENGKSCLVYKCGAEILPILHEINKNPKKFEDMAELGRKCVLEEHDRKKIAKQFFGTFA